MGGLNKTSSGSRIAIRGLGLALTLLSTVPQAEARGWHRVSYRRAAYHRPAPQPASSSAFAALVIDVNTGRTLYGVNQNDLRHPASITKVMTLYLLFEKLDKGEMSLSSPLTVSRHAASQSPTKLGLRPGSTITVENAIKAIVTKSANDMAVAVAEAIGGDEDTFAALMTRKAHALGMSRTTYVNASGLPDNRQITTARDLSILGRAIQDRFPNYYRFFSTPSFTYAGVVMPNHNHLMSRIEGMDGIKTGYTNASGFNLLSNVNRDGHHIVAVVMGGKSAAGRDHIMEGLIAEHLEEAAPTRIAGAIEERPVEAAAETVDTADDDARAAPHDSSPSPSPSPSLIAPTMAVPPPPPRTTVRTAAKPAVPVEKPRPAFVAGAARIDTDRLPGPLSSSERRRIVADGSTSGRAAPQGSTAVALVTATPSTLRWTTGAPPVRGAAAPAGGKVTSPGTGRSAEVDSESTASIREPGGSSRPSRSSLPNDDSPSDAKGGWVIQIGATDTANAASDLLTRAKTEGRSALGSARPMTEKIQRGSATLYRARFAGLAPEQAEAACKALKRSGFSCFTTRD